MDGGLISLLLALLAEIPYVLVELIAVPFEDTAEVPRMDGWPLSPVLRGSPFVSLAVSRVTLHPSRNTYGLYPFILQGDCETISIIFLAKSTLLLFSFYSPPLVV